MVWLSRTGRRPAAPFTASLSGWWLRGKMPGEGEPGSPGAAQLLNQRPPLLPPRPLERPPPWLALPPLLAISRCFSLLIAAKPRFDEPLPLLAIGTLLILDCIVGIGKPSKGIFVHDF